MKNNQRETNGPRDAATSKGPNAKAVEAIASPDPYINPALGAKKRPRSEAELRHSMRARGYGGKCEGARQDRKAAYRASDGRQWAFTGKRARVLELLATRPGGVTQWDTLPWHTRLGGTIHAMRRDGLDISTELEGEFRHARYRLVTPGCLLLQAENRLEPVILHRAMP